MQTCNINRNLSPHRKQTSQYLSASDGYRLFYQHTKGNSGKPVVIYLHGIEGHSQWFSPTAGFLNAHGMSIYAPDRRGAGRNLIERGHLSSYRQLIADIELMLDHAECKCPDSKVFLAGNCWGAKPAVCAALVHRIACRLSGLVLICPAIWTTIDLPLYKKFLVVACYLLNSRRLFNLPLSPRHFTDNPLYIEYIAGDPYRLTRVTASFLLQSRLMSLLVDKAAGRLTLPILVMQSGRDKIVDARRVQQWFERITSADKQFRLFASAAHSLDFEPDPQQYLDCFAQWILSRDGRFSLCA